MKRKKLNSRPKRFIKDIATHTPFTKMIFLLVILWFAFSTGLYFAERGTEGATITSYGDALYWGIAAFSTAGIADTPQSDIAQLIGAIWIVVGSVIFFRTIVATVTTYFMRPMQRPAKKIVDTIEYNLEQLNDLTIDDIDIIEHNEAFASASCSIQKALNIPDEKFNPHGGAVAIGHPLGATGTRCLMTLVNALNRTSGKFGIVTICLGGGNAVAMLIESKII